ncbi:MAG: DUF2911 domain-containing protein [Mucilaginibacter sp.]|nr:DUF2911 domain-containing protein [Mucilaginibacter sp.]
MKKVVQLKALAVLVVALLFTTAASAQKVVASPRDSVSGKVKGATISINYGSPSVKGRKIYGGLQPYGKMWRAGANEATKFTTDKDIMVEGKKLPAGSYTLFVTPGEKEFVVTFNSQLGQWGIKHDGSANEDPAKDALAVTVTGKPAPMTERLKYVLTAKGFELVWDTTSIPVSIK